jgi:hypothetical protein
MKLLSWQSAVIFISITLLFKFLVLPKKGIQLLNTTPEMPVEKGVKLLNTTPEMQVEIRKYIRIGSSLSEVNQVFKESEFKCTFTKNDLYIATEYDDQWRFRGGKRVYSDNSFCAVCKEFIFRSCWNVILGYKNDKVMYIEAKVSSMQF